MPPLAERQHGFAAALLDPALAAPPGLVDLDGQPSLRRFSVYRNNIVCGLTEALQAAFPAVCRIVGDEFFRAMARAYIAAEPPISPILLAYGGGFPDFISRFEPAAQLPYLADVARIERAWAEAYHAAEASALSAQAFAAISLDRAAGMRLTVHPSLRVIRSPFPVLTIWRMNVADGVPQPVDLTANGEDILIVRPQAEVEVRSMLPGGAPFVTALANGYTVAQAFKSTLLADAQFDLAANLAGLIDAGAFVAYQFGSDRSDPDWKGADPA